MKICCVLFFAQKRDACMHKFPHCGFCSPLLDRCLFCSAPFMLIDYTCGASRLPQNPCLACGILSQ